MPTNLTLHDAMTEYGNAMDAAYAANKHLEEVIRRDYNAGVPLAVISEESGHALTLSFLVAIVAGSVTDEKARDALMLSLPEDDGTGVPLDEFTGQQSLGNLLCDGAAELVREPDQLQGIEVRVRRH